MSTTIRYDEQYCPIARAMDVLGDRWVLPILRELMIDDQRFTDLRTHLPGITATVLTSRLRTLAEEGLVTTRELPPPATRSVYALTERGRTVIPVMSALAKWGMPLLEAPAEDQPIRPWSAVHIAVAAYYDAVAAVGSEARYLFRVDGEEHVLAAAHGPVAPEGEPTLVFESSGAVWIDVRQGRVTLADAIAAGRVSVTGSKAALAEFQRIYRVP